MIYLHDPPAIFEAKENFIKECHFVLSSPYIYMDTLHALNLYIPLVYELILIRGLDFEYSAPHAKK